MTYQHASGYNKRRRERLKQAGICVDCQNKAAELTHVCCPWCLEARRARWKRNYQPKVARAA